MTSKTLTQTAFLKIKKDASSLKKSESIKHTEALEIIANREGFATFRDAKACHDASPMIAMKNVILANCSDMLFQVLDQSKSIIQSFRFGADLNSEEIKAIHSDFFNRGIQKPLEPLKGTSLILECSFDHQSLQSSALKLLISTEMQDQLSGLCLLALHDFYGSASDSTYEGDGYHPSFEVFFSMFLRMPGFDENTLKLAKGWHAIFPEIPNQTFCSA
jgi:hypothetical protein